MWSRCRASGFILHSKERADCFKSQCATKVTNAEAVAAQATADLAVVTRLLMLQDAVAVCSAHAVDVGSVLGLVFVSRECVLKAGGCTQRD